MQNQDYSIVTEISGEEVSRAQIDRVVQRYYWAAQFCRDKDVIEVACGVGQGLGHLATVARSVKAGDITPALVDRATRHYGDRIPVTVIDAHRLPFPEASADVVILFEAIYYLRSAEDFIDEARRVLRPGGRLLLATANKSLFDFNPSPFSVRYFTVPELDALLNERGFTALFFAGSPASTGGVKQKAIRVMKKAAVAMRVIPSSMKGKRFLKRLVFGRLVPMPPEIGSAMPFEPPVPIPSSSPDVTHQVIYCAATRR